MKHLFSLIAALVALNCLCLAPAHAGRGGMGSGGGNFTVPVFWVRVDREIRPRLVSLKTEKSPLLSAKQIDQLLALMTPRVTRVSLSTTQLYVTSKDGKQDPVDALNYPKLKRIVLHKETWQYKVNTGFDVNHLILHEFMGLAQINDEMGLSAKVIPPSQRSLDFASDEVRCQTAIKYIRVQNDSWQIRDMPETEEMKVKLSAPRSLNPNPKCGKVDPATKKCLQYVSDFKVREANVSIPVEFDKEDSFDGTYSVDASITLVSGYMNYGWGAAASTLFSQAPQFNIVWRLVHLDSNNQRRVLTIINDNVEKTDEFRDRATLTQQIPVPVFIETIEKNGFKLSLAPYGGEMTQPFHSYGIAGFLDQTAQNAGYTDHKQADRFIIDKVLGGARYSIPFRVWASCYLQVD